MKSAGATGVDRTELGAGIEFKKRRVSLVDAHREEDQIIDELRGNLRGISAKLKDNGGSLILRVLRLGRRLEASMGFAVAEEAAERRSQKCDEDQYPATCHAAEVEAKKTLRIICANSANKRRNANER